MTTVLYSFMPVSVKEVLAIQALKRWGKIEEVKLIFTLTFSAIFIATGVPPYSSAVRVELRD